MQKGAAESNLAHFMPFANYGDDAVDTRYLAKHAALLLVYVLQHILGTTPILYMDPFINEVTFIYINECARAF